MVHPNRKQSRQWCRWEFCLVTQGDLLCNHLTLTIQETAQRSVRMGKLEFELKTQIDRTLPYQRAQQLMYSQSRCGSVCLEVSVMRFLLQEHGLTSCF